MILEYFNKKAKQQEEKPKEFWRIKEWFNDIPDEKIDKLKLFNSELIKYNPSLSLVSEKTLVFSDVIHFSDCILACREIVKDTKPTSVTDIGAGNGFPGIIMGILYPEIKITIIERDARKVEFLNQVVTLLKQDNIVCSNGWVDSVKPGSLDVVVMRGFTVISKALLLLRKQVKRGGNLYVMKSEEWATEVANIPSQLCSFWTPSLVGEYRLPVGEVKFAVVKLNKIAE